MSRGRWASQKEMLEEVYAIGAALIAKKAELEHGQFRRWVEGPDGPGCSYRTVRLYMQLHREMGRADGLLQLGYEVPPPPKSLRQLATETQTPRGRLRPAIGTESAIPLPAGDVKPPKKPSKRRSR